MSNSILRREIEASPDYDNILKFLHNNIPINPNAKPAPKPFKQDFSKNYNASNLGDAPLKAALSGFNLVFSDSAPATENDTAGNFKYYDFVFPKKGNTRKDVTTLIRTYRTKRTDGAWDYPEGDSQKKFMILYCPPKANVRKDKATNSDLSPKELEKFPIITSLEYKSLSIDDYLIYMEV
jgi:hypothetical protein